MPCRLESWEIEYEEKQENRKKFGKELTDVRLLEEVACQMGRLIYKSGLIEIATPLVKKWIDHHQELDAMAGRPWRKSR